MYEVKQTAHNGLETLTAEIVSCNVLEIEVGTNGYQGGDSGHGCKTYFRMADLGGTDIEVKANKDPLGQQEVVIELGGDSELSTFLESLKFAVKVLEDQIANNP